MAGGKFKGGSVAALQSISDASGASLWQGKANRRDFLSPVTGLALALHTWQATESDLGGGLRLGAQGKHARAGVAWSVGGKPACRG